MSEFIKDSAVRLHNQVNRAWQYGDKDSHKEKLVI